jgi:hypothetical protein
VTESSPSIAPRLGHYLYAHRALPRAFLRDPAPIMGILASEDAMAFLSGMWDVLAGEIAPEERAPSDGLAVEHYSYEGDIFVALIVMPPPHGGLEAWFVAAVARFEGDDAFARCFTLDRIPELDPSAAVLEWDVDGNRKLHRDGCPPTREAFLDAVEEIVAPRPG